MNGLTDDDPTMGQGGPPGMGPPPGMGGGGPPPPQQPPGPGMAAFARQRMGPQVSAPGPGNMADSMNLIIQAIKILEHATQGMTPGDKLHGDVHNAIQKLSKHLGGPAGMGPAAGIQKTMLGDQLKRTIQSQLLSRVQGMMGQGGPGGGQQQQPPMPATPLPGA